MNESYATFKTFKSLKICLSIYLNVPLRKLKNSNKFPDRTRIIDFHFPSSSKPRQKHMSMSSKDSQHLTQIHGNPI